MDAASKEDASGVCAYGASTKFWTDVDHCGIDAAFLSVLIVTKPRRLRRNEWRDVSRVVVATFVLFLLPVAGGAHCEMRLGSSVSRRSLKQAGICAQLSAL